MDLLYYLAKDWVLGEYECWALVCDVYHRELGIDLPLINLGSTAPRVVRKVMASASPHQLFDPIPEPQHLSVVAMGKRYLSHVGVWLNTADGPRILHNRLKCGVLCQAPAEVQEHISILGYYGLKNNAVNCIL